LHYVGKIRDEYAISHSVPDRAVGYVARPELEAAIADRLRTRRIYVLAGLSGLGKSEIAAAVARVVAGEYDMVVWVTATSVTSLNDLKAIDVERRSRKVNLLHLLRDRRCLVVLDDLGAAIPAASLRDTCGSRSVVLVTRQTADPGEPTLPPLNQQEARGLLEKDVPDRCPDEVFAQVWATVGGHPLALKLVNAGARAGGWNDIKEDCASVGEYPDESRPQRLADRLLGRLREPLANELAFFAWCGSPRADRSLARHVLAPLGPRKLEMFCLLAADRHDVLRLHDIVYAALQSVGVAAGDRADAFEEKLASYIESLASAKSGDLPFLNLRDIHRHKLEQLAAQRADRDAYLYCVLHAWDDAEVSPGLVGDPFARAWELMEAGSPADIAVVTVIEAVEALYRKRKHDEGVEVARGYLLSQLDVFDVLERAPGISRAARLRTMHHHAKALRNVQRFDNAISLCEWVLREEPLPGTRLLLARLLLHEEAGRDRAKDLLYGLLEEARQSPRDAEISVTLAAIETLGRHQLNRHLREALARFGGVIAEYIVAGAARGLDLAYTAFAAIGRDLQYNDEQLFYRILGGLPDRHGAEVRSDRERAAWGDILLSAAKGMEPDRRERALREAVSFYRAMENPESFNLQQLGKAHYQLGEFELAAGILGPIVRERSNPWNQYWLSKTRLAQGDAEGALLLIDEVLRDERRAHKYRPTLLEHRYEIRRALRDEGAIEDLEAAVAACDNQKYREALERKLTAVRL
jgi:hypothetical protein